MKMKHNFVIWVSCALIAVCSGCDIVYVSKTTIAPTPPETKVRPTGKDAEFIKNTFEEYCAKQQFSYHDPGLARPGVIHSCGAAWFYSAALYPADNHYLIELRLMRPGPWRTDTKFFCEETRKMYDFFSNRIGPDRTILDRYGGCK